MIDLHHTRANEFDRLVGEIQAERAMLTAGGRWALDLGCGFGHFTALLSERFDCVTGLDISKELIGIARQSEFQRTMFVIADAQNFNLGARFDSIFIMNLLEHVEDPVAVLRCAKKHLVGRGRVHIVVPNAFSFNRRLGQVMGLIDDVHDLSDEQRQLYGHVRVYDPYTLTKDVAAAGLRVLFEDRIMLKPFPNADMQRLCDEHGSEWAKKLVRALYELGSQFPRMCASIYVEAMDND